MADNIQYRLEACLPKLLELQSKCIFSKTEIRQLLRRRREFEYKCIAKGCLKKDFLDYLQYEIAFESLRQQRCLKAKLESAQLSNLSHIFSIFDRALLIWPQDVLLWNQYIDFCLRAGSTKHVLKVLSRALAQHPAEVNFWLLAADRELKLGHLEAPRNLLMLGLRQAPTSLKLWQESFRFEIKCLIRITAAGLAKGLKVNVNCDHLEVIFDNALKQLAEDQQRNEFLLTSLDLLSALLAVPEAEHLPNLSRLEARLTDELMNLSQTSIPIQFLVWKLKALSSSDIHCLIEELVENRVSPITANNKTFVWQCLILQIANILDDTNRLNNKQSIELGDTPLFSLNISGEPTFNPDCSQERNTANVPVIHTPIQAVYQRSLCQDTLTSKQTLMVQALIYPTISFNFFSSVFPKSVPLLKPSKELFHRIENERMIIRTKLSDHDKNTENIYETVIDKAIQSWDAVTICTLLPLLHCFIETYTSQFSKYKKENVNWKALIDMVDTTTLSIVSTDIAANFLAFRSVIEYSTNFDNKNLFSLCRKDRLSLEALEPFISLEREALTTFLKSLYDKNDVLKDAELKSITQQESKDCSVTKDCAPDTFDIPFKLKDYHQQLSKRLNNIYAVCKRSHLSKLAIHVMEELLCKNKKLFGLELQRAAERTFAPHVLPVEREIIYRTIGAGWISHALEQLAVLVEDNYSSAYGLANEIMNYWTALINHIERCETLSASLADDYNVVESINPHLVANAMATRYYSVARCIDATFECTNFRKVMFASIALEELGPLIRRSPSMSRKILTLNGNVGGATALRANAAELLRCLNCC